MRHHGSTDGRVLGGRYRLGDVLGTGGTSVVWRARDEVLARDVAVKVLSGPHTADAAARLRIRVEARAAASLAHPNVAQIYDFGETVEDGQRIPYIVMELVPGPTLAQRATNDDVPPAEALRICAEIAAGLAAAHADGMVHRDVKPANVILAPTGAKVVDFGVAAATDPATTVDDEVLGTPAYLAPERIANGPVTPASDVYSLGVLLYLLLTRRLPWAVTDAAEVLEAHLHRRPAPLPELDGVPPHVTALCLRCLAKDPADRPTAHELAVALAAGRPATPFEHPHASGRRRRAGLLAAGLAGAAATAVLVWLLLPGPEHLPPPEARNETGIPAPSALVADSATPSNAASAVSTVGAAPVTRPAPTRTGTTPAAPPSDPPAAPPSAPSSPATSSPPPPVTFTSDGGTIRAECTPEGLAHLVSWSATSPFRVRRVDAGPATTAVASFARGGRTIDMTVTCTGTTPTVSTTTNTD
ncbi:serine/threonine-protein kinase [Dactylosporangium darangshiense]|uniref:non-specific serine/threonine protein kinase n=1 Tax=Dactylosporangium darangshiense TaxID=579108 RepID=A0ABP8CYF8_9ACTN